LFDVKILIPERMPKQNWHISESIAARDVDAEMVHWKQNVVKASGKCKKLLFCKYFGYVMSY